MRVSMKGTGPGWCFQRCVVDPDTAGVMRQAARDVIRKYELYGESDSSKGKRSPQVLPWTLKSSCVSG